MSLWKEGGKKGLVFSRQDENHNGHKKHPTWTNAHVRPALRDQNSKPRPTHPQQTRNSSFQESRKCLVTPCACVHPFGSHRYTPSSSEKAETPAHAGSGAASRVPLPLRMRSGLASCCEAERKDGFFFLFPPLFFPHLPRTGPEIALGLVGSCYWPGPARAC